MKTSRAAFLGLVVLTAASLVQATAPTVQALRVDSVPIGESVILHAEVADTDADLDYLTFQVSGPGVSGWLNLGSLNVSGTAASAELPWRPQYTGVYTVSVTVHDLSVAASQQATFEVFTGRRIVSDLTIGAGVNRLIQDSGEILTRENLTGAEVTVQDGGNLILWSGGRVTLKPGFRAENGSFFWAAVDHDMNGYSDLEETTDTDGDGIPDAWEADHGLNPIDAGDASLDRDGDGLTNLEEYQQGGNIDLKDNPIVGFAVFTPSC